MSFIDISRGNCPLVLGLPHTGTDLPDGIGDRLNETGLALSDTDWHIHRLYAGLVPDVTTVRTRIHRYAIDVNRAPSDESLYPGQNTTGLCPVTDFDGNPIYKSGAEPDPEEVSKRVDAWHGPYHDALSAELERVRGINGFAILYDCHSIRSHIPFLFDGTLPDFNIGTNGGATCAPELAARVADICVAAQAYTSVVNGRFRGGWTTRHYGRPEEGVHAIQMELAQSTYMHEVSPWHFIPDRAEPLRAVLTTFLTSLLDWTPT